MKWVIWAFALAAIPALAQETTGEAAIMRLFLNAPSAAAWNIYGLPQPALKKDDAVKGGYMLRVSIDKKGTNPWDVVALSAINKPVMRGDAILVGFWARANVPAEGLPNGIFAAISVQEAKSPFAALFSETASVGSNWAMYYTSGVAKQDYAAGTILLSVQLAAAKQEIDFGPVFIVDLGPHQDISKLPHNIAAPSAAAVETDPLIAAETKFARELVGVRTGLPVKGRLISDPSTMLSAFGPDQFSHTVPAPDYASGTAIRVTMPKAAANDWDDAAGLPVTGAIKKGDIIHVAVLVRSVEPADDATKTGKICAMGVNYAQSPWTPVMMRAVTVKPGGWQLVRASGVAQTDIPAGGAMVSLHLGCAKQVLEFGPAFVLDLGPDGDAANLPGN